MCAYNRIDGKPACAQRHADHETSCAASGSSRATSCRDCGAIDDIYLRHKVAPRRARSRGARREDRHGPRSAAASYPESRRRGEAGADHRGGDRHVGEATVPRAVQARDVRLDQSTVRVGADSDQRAGPAGAPRARAARRARVDGAAQERRATCCRCRRRSKTDRRDRAERRSVADAARQLQRHAVGSDHAAARHSRGGAEDARVLYARRLRSGRRISRCSTSFRRSAARDARRHAAA